MLSFRCKSAHTLRKVIYDFFNVKYPYDKNLTFPLSYSNNYPFRELLHPENPGNLSLICKKVGQMDIMNFCMQIINNILKT